MYITLSCIGLYHRLTRYVFDCQSVSLMCIIVSLIYVGLCVCQSDMQSVPLLLVGDVLGFVVIWQSNLIFITGLCGIL